MIKVYLAAIAACHIRFGGLTASQDPMIYHFKKDTRRPLPVSRTLVSLWLDMAVVLE